MAWSRDKASPSDINNNNQFTTNDVLTVQELNAMVNNSFYGVDFAEAMADTPDTSDAGSVGTPTVTLVDNVKNGHTYKKFKFSNLKGATGEKGDKGDTGNPGITVSYNSTTKVLSITTNS